ncbi:MAG: hypothetical protein ACTSVY_16490 [Candidatus Helarchaeota archaeon]
MEIMNKDVLNRPTISSAFSLPNCSFNSLNRMILKITTKNMVIILVIFHENGTKLKIIASNNKIRILSA